MNKSKYYNLKDILEVDPNSAIGHRTAKSPFHRKSYLGNFMLINMLGHLWLDGKEIPWPEHTVVLPD